MRRAGGTSVDSTRRAVRQVDVARERMGEAQADGGCALRASIEREAGEGERGEGKDSTSHTGHCPLRLSVSGTGMAK
jgi:hypothetical protein